MKHSRQTAKLPSPPTSSRKFLALWLALAAITALFVVFQVYRPALHGPFVWDDRELPFFHIDQQTQPFLAWVSGNRPLLMGSFWLNFRIGGLDPWSYHVANVVLHWITSILVALVVARLLSWAGVRGMKLALLSGFGGALFLLHPLQTESVSYVASRSEALSVPLYLAAYAVFLYRPSGPVSIGRGLAIGVLTGAALTTKEHTLTLPVLLALTDLFWNPKKLRENAVLYGLMGAIGVIGALYVFGILSTSLSAGFALKGLSPLAYFLTECRVIWRYVGLFFFPAGQNIDTDFPVSQGLFDHGAIFGLLGLIAVVSVALWFRNKWPLASFGVLVFLLLIAPTSSVIPIMDVVAERRTYLPFLGLILIGLEGMRRLTIPYVVVASVAVVAVCGWLTYQRNVLWGSPLALWQDTTMKSPQKVRPRFQMAYYLYNSGECQIAADNFKIASDLGPPSAALLVNWGAALLCASRPLNAIRVLTDAAELTPNFDLVHVYMGDAYAKLEDDLHAREEYQRAIALNPSGTLAKEELLKLDARGAKQK